MDDMGDEIMSASYGAAPAPLPSNEHHFAGEKIVASSDDEEGAPLPMADQGIVNPGDHADLEEELFGGDEEDDDAVDEGQVLDEAEQPEPRSDAAYDQAHAAAHAGEDLFDEAEEEKEPQPRRPVDEYGQEITEEEWAKRKKLEYEEEEGDEVYGAREDVTAEVIVANIPTPFATDDKVRRSCFEAKYKADSATGLGPEDPLFPLDCPRPLHRGDDRRRGAGQRAPACPGRVDSALEMGRCRGRNRGPSPASAPCK